MFLKRVQEVPGKLCKALFRRPRTWRRGGGSAGICIGLRYERAFHIRSGSPLPSQKVEQALRHLTRLIEHPEVRLVAALRFARVSNFDH